jgi:hypothetical protein
LAEEIKDFLRRLRVVRSLLLLLLLLLLRELQGCCALKELLGLNGAGIKRLIEVGRVRERDVRRRRSEVVEQEIDVREDLFAAGPETRDLSGSSGRCCNR